MATTFDRWIAADAHTPEREQFLRKGECAAADEAGLRDLLARKALRAEHVSIALRPGMQPCYTRADTEVWDYYAAAADGTRAPLTQDNLRDVYKSTARDRRDDLICTNVEPSTRCPVVPPFLYVEAFSSPRKTEGAFERLTESMAGRKLVFDLDDDARTGPPVVAVDIMDLADDVSEDVGSTGEEDDEDDVGDSETSAELGSSTEDEGEDAVERVLHLADRPFQRPGFVFSREVLDLVAEMCRREKIEQYPARERGWLMESAEAICRLIEVFK